MDRQIKDKQDGRHKQGQKVICLQFSFKWDMVDDLPAALL